MSKATTVKQYLDALPEDRRKALEAVRRVIKSNLDSKYEEGIQYGMIGYYVPHSVFADGYHCDPKQPLPFASIASQKNHMAVYLFCLYNDPAEIARFEAEWKKTGKKLDMGKSCVRFKKLDDVALDAIGAAIKRMPAKKFVELYVANRDGAAGARKTAKKAAKKTAKKAAKKATKKTTGKKAAKKVVKKAAKKVAKQAPRRTAKR
ncbi:MAG: DUF1801 domain-containing protein [Planctomycetes bacterium]|nr:DUF1801 domain-containing protein [Planctomycetota bacterium]